MAGRLCDKVAIITGSSRGIGKGIARTFAFEGAKLLLVARDDKVGTRVAEEIGQAGSRIAFCRADLSSLLDVKTMVQVALETFGQLSVRGFPRITPPSTHTRSLGFSAIIGERSANKTA